MLRTDSYEWIIADLDGTLCDTSEREHLAQRRLWDEFHRAGRTAKARKAEVAVVNAWRESRDYRRVAILTGRTDTHAQATAVWLKQHCVCYDLLIMRGADDTRPDTDYKRSIYEEVFRQREVVFVLEDRSRVVAMWRTLGVPCFQVQLGDY